MVKPQRRVYYGWVVVTAISGIEFANAASAIGILTVFLNPMISEFGWSRTEVAGATSLGAILGAAMAPFAGRLVDRVGSRVILAVGGMVVGLGCVFLFAAQTLAGFYVAFTLVRIADQGLIKIGASPAVGKWFLRRRGRAMAMVFFAGSAGIIVMAPVVQLVIDTWGWRIAWLVLAGLMFAIGVAPSLLFVRRQPEDMGLRIDGAAPEQAAPDATAETTDPGDLEVAWPIRQVVRTPTFWLILVSLFVASTGSSGVGLHLIPHLTQQGLTSGQAVGAISIMSASGAAAALILGFLSERVSPKLMICLLYLLAAVSMVVLIRADTLAETYLFAVLQGIVGSGVNTLAPILWASYYGRWTLGSIYGLSRAAQVAGFAVGPLVSGIVYDATNSYQNAFGYFTFTALVGFVLLLMARKPVKPSE